MPTFIDAQCDLPMFAAARRTDPATSQAASVSSRSFSGDHTTRILAALAAGPAGKTEIGRRCGLTEQQVARRMHELRRAGLVERTGRVGRSESGCDEHEYRRASAQ
jgi:predicted ArsR family transcriptional regulator